MRSRLEAAGVLVEIALRNLLAHRLKTVIIGGIILFGAVLVVVGSSLLDSVDRSMARSIQGSVAGHIQVYSARSKDELAVFGSMGGFPEISAIDDFSRIKKTLEAVPNVKAVVPMGISGAVIAGGNTVDIALSKLRDAVRKHLAGDSAAGTMAELGAQKSHVRQMVSVLHGDMKNLAAIADESAVNREALADIARADSEEFWAGFDQDSLAALEFLENKIAVQAADADLLWISYVGTDMEAFARSFDRMEIVDGGPVPAGHRGFLFAKFFYEERLKLKNARRLDKIKNAIEASGRRIAGDPELKRFVRENVAQVKEIVFQLDAVKTQLAVERLQRALGSKETALPGLLASFFRTDDANFHSRYEAFYRDLAPLLDLYRIRVGDTLTIKAFTKTGYIQSVNLPVYGTFQFKGLEKSALAGVLNMMDLISFRDLYGYLTSEKKEEIEKIKAAAGSTSVDRENAEAELFGGAGREVVAEATPGVIDELQELEGAGRELRREDLAQRVYSKEELEHGVVLNAAVMLHDPSRLEETMRAIDAAASRDGLELKTVSWQQASGLIGQMVLLLRLVLYVAVLIIFVVALVIINNAMVMATLERVREIGTMRAIGTQRNFILVMLLVETAVVGLLFGALGAGVGTAIVKAIAAVGIPATSDVMYFFFSGPRLIPFLGTSNLAAAFTIVLVVSALSALYPAWLAMRVAPVEAMQSDE